MGYELRAQTIVRRAGQAIRIVGMGAARRAPSNN